MVQKTLISLIIFTLSAISAAAQGNLVFTPSSWDFGTIREADGKLTHTFTGKNQGDKPVVILDVVTTCGCTVPRFSKQPVLPGETTRIEIRFDPANRPGSFAKELAVYSSDRVKIATLTVRGTVIPRERSLEELYPVDTGGSLHLNSGLCTFSYVYQGQPAQASVGYANSSKRPITLELRPLESSGFLQTDYPHEIAPGERGEINLSYFIPSSTPRYGTLRDVLEIRIDGRISRIPLVVHGIGVDNPSSTTDNQAPKAQLAKNMIKFGAVKRSASIQRQPLVLTNAGNAPLIVRAVEVDGPVACSLRAGEYVAPGKSFAAEVTLSPSALNYGVTVGHIILITNDPVRPMRRLRVTAIIED